MLKARPRDGKRKAALHFTLNAESALSRHSFPDRDRSAVLMPRRDTTPKAATRRVTINHLTSELARGAWGLPRRWTSQHGPACSLRSARRGPARRRLRRTWGPRRLLCRRAFSVK